MAKTWTIIKALELPKNPSLCFKAIIKILIMKIIQANTKQVIPKPKVALSNKSVTSFNSLI